MTDTPPRRASAPRHVGFPLRLDIRGRTALVDDETYLRGLVEQVLFTASGERVNRPDFGSGVGRLVFAPSGDALAQSTQALVQGALQSQLGDLLRVESVQVDRGRFAGRGRSHLPAAGRHGPTTAPHGLRDRGWHAMTVTDLPIQAAIDQEARRDLVRDVAGLDGIDFVEVLSNHADAPGYVPGAPQQRTLLVHLLNGPVPGDWDASRVGIVGGVRVDPTLNPVRAVWAHPATAVAGTTSAPPVDPLDGVSPGDRLLVQQALPDDEARLRALVVRTSSSGDRSTYTLRLLGPGGVGAPPGVDLALSTASFAFTVDCPSDLDCAPAATSPPPPEDLLPGDYLARDYAALRTRLLDRLSTLLPDWTDRNPADPVVMLAELFAAVGDRLAAWQDAIAVEAYLGTARRRTSIRRHAPAARLRDARGLLGTHTSRLHHPHHPRRPRGDTGNGPARPTRRHGRITHRRNRSRRNSVRNRIRPDDHPGARCATAVRLERPRRLPSGRVDRGVRHHAGRHRPDAADRRPADPRRPAGQSRPPDGDPTRRFPVRLVADARQYLDPLNPSVWVWEIRWSTADALAAPLQVTQQGEDNPRAVALANVVVADHGASVAAEPIVPSTVPADGAYGPRLPRPGLAYVDRVLPSTAAATALLAPDPRAAVESLTLDDGERTWTPRPDLLASGRLDAHMVVEPEPGGVSRLRFGDGITGRAPGAGSTIVAIYRVGSGTAGNIAPNRLMRLLAPTSSQQDAWAGAKVCVWNPLPGIGGTDPEDMEQVRQTRPAAFRRQLRAVTSPDYATVAEQDPGVQRAVARRRWTGSWYAQEVTLDPVAAHADDPALLTEVTAALELRRMAGVDVELERPLYIALELVLDGCVLPGYLRPDVERGLAEVFSSGLRSDGQRGFFHSDRFTFGQPLLLSDVVAAAMAVDGLAWVQLSRFARADATPAQAATTLAAGEIAMASRELLRCDSDPDDPEAGHIDFRLGGGS